MNSLENDYTERCGDCFCLVEDEDGDWFCDEYEMKCEDVCGLCGEWSN